MSIKEIATSLEDKMVETRRYMHMHPEVSFKEEKTYEFILDKLKQYDGLKIRENVGKNNETTGKGLFATFGEGHPHIAFRADFDALPIVDQKDVPYKSQNEGVMHACGHDGHTSTLIALVDAVSHNKDKLKGSVSFIFQFGEETAPGGAKFMIEDGILEDVDKVYGQHYWSQFPTHEIRTRKGELISSPDTFKVKIKGRGGHAAHPGNNIDAILIAAEMITSLQTAVARQIAPLENAVVTIGKISAGNSFNVMPDVVEFEGTVRTFKPEIKQKIKEIFELEVEYTAKKRGAIGMLNYIEGYPAVVNLDREAEVVEEAAKALGLEFVEAKPSMIGEDFSMYIQDKPGAFFYTGSGSEGKNSTFAHHHEKFDLDEDAMKTALQMFMKILEIEEVVTWG
ncbi:M20 metallopeptidase family protein [Phocicoccus pinnipedialis]|uniref:N-acyl-L-amino acid amidohydrolase n=1 Tax=Phocicoccus pinnipedialis TaxID=110845 RepID=A0A6V7R4P9_9BACL|nr:amidohydrolase [Jeotgalicoccus pinnipedialis]MBP1940047.1 amidohydrolase [Jeotgalicoccus pinnipedialis]CAD2072005.1 N-acyl-L-amino acid amidohydrolase [Jeotgalicoccus pinnipedialis]